MEPHHACHDTHIEKHVYSEIVPSEEEERNNPAHPGLTDEEVRRCLWATYT